MCGTWSRAYRLLVTGLPRSRAKARVFNVCTGRSVSAAEHVQMLASLLAPITVEHEVDPARVRAHEVMDIRGDAARLARRDRLGARDPSAPDDGRHHRVVGARAGARRRLTARGPLALSGLHVSRAGCRLPDFATAAPA